MREFSQVKNVRYSVGAETALKKNYQNTASVSHDPPFDSTAQSQSRKSNGAIFVGDTFRYAARRASRKTESAN